MKNGETCQLMTIRQLLLLNHRTKHLLINRTTSVLISWIRARQLNRCELELKKRDLIFP